MVLDTAFTTELVAIPVTGVATAIHHLVALLRNLLGLRVRIINDIDFKDMNGDSCFPCISSPNAD